jgi:hypothetical protein
MPGDGKPLRDEPPVAHASRVPGDGDPAGDEPTEAHASPARAEDGRAVERRAPRSGGFRSQPTALRVLLFASLAALAIGVVRCSIELSGIEPITPRIGVERAVVELDDSTAWAPADSVGALAGRRFVASLRDVATVDARLAPPGSSGFDGVARIRVTGADGVIEVAVSIVDVRTGRQLFETTGVGAPEMLPGLLSRAAVGAAAELGIVRDRGGGGEQTDGDSGGP